ncbi:MAG: hypothetical protein H5T60_04985 [Anaerolineae bacterium]|nr:hypothetical protein [Anaerolineae bacterium]
MGRISGLGRKPVPRGVLAALFVLAGLIIIALLSFNAPAWARPHAANGIFPVVYGTVHLQGRPAPPAPSWSVPLAVTLECGVSTLPGLYTYSVTTDQTGHFTFTHVVSYTSTCDFRVKNPHTLRNVKYNVTINAGDNYVDMGTLREGDANNDNRVSLVDFSILATAYDSGPGNPRFDPRADFNENDWIEIADFSLLATNYDRAGDIPVSMPAAAVSASTAPTVTLKLVPAYWAAPVGDIFMVDIRMDPHAQPFQGVAVFLRFNPADLQVVDAQGNPATEIEDSGNLPVLIRNQVDNSAGEISFSAGILEGTPPAEEFSLARMYLKVTGVNIAGSPVEFVIQDYPPKTGVTYDGYYLPLEIQDLTARLGEVRILWPLFMRRASTLPEVP